MESKIIGKVNFEDDLLNKELALIDTFEFNDSYSEYASGIWKTCMLWNRSGLKNDHLSIEHDQYVKPTEYGKQLSYVNDIVDQLFKKEHIKAIRLFMCINGLIIPHRDYLEFKKGFTRIHIPLKINEHALTSEEDIVYNMQKGEIWFIEGRKIHSAANFSKTKRINLVIDFAPEIPFEELFQNLENYQPDLTPKINQRQQLKEEELSYIKGLSKIINEMNFDDILSILSKIHFYRDVSSELVFNWLDEIASSSNNYKIQKRVQEVTDLLIRKGPVH
ncbi:aspartyl/asparaginyl beta-hydroxylase domain-containing protein [uncultured Kordia sp.]|uniref:aspartyl/asparaginyl beta-hydroxylase domain-containing protein n=1 Tax=uncultured Kordia sp. TaxID=507699 RepID=UPI0026039DF4|nr:aspartyl/asparaginyl beta-hydroxylase domain-containing protein [uncultured Kordia sp.]